MGMFLQDAGHVLPAILVGSLKVAPFTSTQTSMGKTTATTKRYVIRTPSSRWQVGIAQQVKR